MKLKFTLSELTFGGMFTALITVGAFIKIPLPMIPFTLQVLFVILAGLLLGKRIGSLSVIVYIVMGLIGVPVFTQGGGIGYLVKPTFGYIIGFLVAVYIMGSILERSEQITYKRMIVATGIGLFIIYLIGMSNYYIICNFVIHTPISLSFLFKYCFLMCIPGDIISSVLAIFISKRLLLQVRKYINIRK